MEMKGCSEEDGDRPRLLNFIPNHRQWLSAGDVAGKPQISDENKLELKLGLPGEADWSGEGKNDSVISFGGFPVSSNFIGKLHQPSKISPFCSKMGDLVNAEAKSFHSSVNANSSQKRAAPAPVVGWPPVRLSRRNLASTSFSKPMSETSDAAPSKLPSLEEKPVKVGGKGLFVKINMDGVPIGRKIDLNAYDNYEKLSTAVDELFRGLLAAQKDCSNGGILNKQEEDKLITGLLDGSGEYTLVYEDNEGDRVLVGDVPWQMFVSTAKRLRVLKTSELPALSIGCSKQQKMSIDSATK